MKKELTVKEKKQQARWMASDTRSLLPRLADYLKMNGLTLSRPFEPSKPKHER